MWLTETNKIGKSLEKHGEMVSRAQGKTVKRGVTLGGNDFKGVYSQCSVGNAFSLPDISLLTNATHWSLATEARV